MSNDKSNENVFFALLEQDYQDPMESEPHALELKSQESIIQLKDKWMSEFL
jgi:hypothetical protein